MTWLALLLGTALILGTVRDIFHTLWHPHGMGGLARQVFVAAWRLPRRVSRGRAAEINGPLALALAAVTWTAGFVVGFALVYLPFMPEGFSITTPISREDASVLNSVYLSLVVVGTLGLGDVTPVDPWLRLVVPLQALLGFMLFTAIISWVLQLYPALARRRAFARQLASMVAADTVDLVPSAEPSVAVQLLEEVRDKLATIDVDLAQYGESYFFREGDPELSLPAQLPYAQQLVQAAARSESAEVRHAGLMLGHGLSQFALRIRHEFLRRLHPDTDTAGVLAAYAEDHRQR